MVPVVRDNLPGSGREQATSTPEREQRAYRFQTPFYRLSHPGFLTNASMAACYSVDKALCGFSSPSSTRLQNLQSMNKLEYLSSEELIAWWEVSLCKLDELIKSQDTVSMSDTFRVADIMTANQTLQEMEDKLAADCWPTMLEYWEVWQGVPGGIVEIERQIEKRTERLRLAAGSLNTTFENAKKRAGSETSMKNTEAHAAESRSREVVTEGWHLETLLRSITAADF